MTCRYRADKKNQANIAAAHKTPTTLAIERFRRRKSPSSTSGAGVLISIATNSVSRTQAPASSLSVRPDVQPSWLPFTIAYTATTSDEVTANAPATSTRRDDRDT